MSASASRAAQSAVAAHQRNIDLLNALRETQAEHSRVLAEHSRVLAEHGRRLDGIDTNLDAVHGKLGQLALGMHTIEDLLRRALDAH